LSIQKHLMPGNTSAYNDLPDWVVGFERTNTMAGPAA